MLAPVGQGASTFTHVKTPLEYPILFKKHSGVPDFVHCPSNILVFISGRTALRPQVLRRHRSFTVSRECLWEKSVGFDVMDAQNSQNREKKNGREAPKGRATKLPTIGKNLEAKESPSSTVSYGFILGKPPPPQA